MTQPKANWELSPTRDNADCRVGPFNLEVHLRRDGGQWRVYQDDLLADGQIKGPCDIADLMRLAEAELARRLNGAAESMDGRELVAEVCEHAWGDPEGSFNNYSYCARCGMGKRLDDDRFGLSSPPRAGKTAMMLEAEEIAERMGASLRWLTDPLAEGERGSLGYAEVHKVVAQATFSGDEDPYLRATREFMRKNPPCSVCGAQPKLCADVREMLTGNVDRTIVAVVYPCSCHSLTPGSRDWAIALMKRGNTVIDKFARSWRCASDGEVSMRVGLTMKPAIFSLDELLRSSLVGGWHLESA